MDTTLRMGDFNVTLDRQSHMLISHSESKDEPLGELKLFVHLKSGELHEAAWAGMETSISGTGLLIAKWGSLTIESNVELLSDIKAMHWGVDVQAGAAVRDFAIEARLILRGQTDTPPRWLVPGFFYKNNRLESSVRMYPGYVPGEGNAERFLSPFWNFRADRCADPIVFAWTNRTCAFLGGSERFAKGGAGLGFSGLQGEDPTLSLWFPYREEPVKYSFFRTDKSAPEQTWMSMKADEYMRLRFMMGFAQATDLHAYAPVLKHRYERHVRDMSGMEIGEDGLRRHKPKPESWTSHAQGAALAVEGLMNFHYNPEESIIYETCSFDKYFGKFGGYVDRPNMHTAWVSGAPVAYSMLWYGRDKRRPELVEAACRVLDNIASAQTPIGTFWGRWGENGKWDTGWNPKEEWIHTRTLAEACLFVLRALRVERMYDADHPQWSEAVKSTIEFILGIQREDGSFGTYYNIHTGKVEEWDGAGGILWISTLLLANEVYNDNRMQEAAEKAGHYYERFLEDEFLYGAPEDVHLTPTSEDGYNALMAYMHLYQYRFLKRWLHLCKKSADWLLTFRFNYDVEFPKQTMLGQYRYRTFGGDIASSSNAHIHCYGLICHPELKKLSMYLNDDYYRRRAMEHLECSLQGLAREDGDVNARRGMVSEQFYYTDWWQPKGAMLQLSHSWCLGLILYACLFETSVAGLETVFR